MNNSDLLPCEVNARTTCATCNLHNNGCPIEATCGALGAYDIVKAMNTVKTTAKPGYDIQELVQKKFPTMYKSIYALPILDWSNLDGVLDYLYGSCELFPSYRESLKELIDFIEAHCEIKNG